MSSADRIGVVVIGRNEGERLRRCLASVVRTGVPAANVVYVDSNSTDGSVAMARGMGVTVVELDMTTPFTAARARNAGVEKLPPGLDFVQFVDGDCEVRDGWLETASAYLRDNPQYAIVAGRCRERFPEASIYNRLADLEWDAPVGEASECGGIMMARLSAFRQVGGFNGAVACGEEPEMCSRLRAAGWRVYRLGAEMCWHDSAMTRFRQYWKRMVRGGYGYAEVSQMNRRGGHRIYARQSRSILLWGAALPLAIAALAWPLPLAAGALAAAYPLQVARIAVKERRRRGLPAKVALAYAGLIMSAKFAQALGQSKYWSNRLRGKRNAVLQYSKETNHHGGTEARRIQEKVNDGGSSIMPTATP